ncbi:MAG TPA: hypothetical protein VFW50_26965 [Streptosporangiaceae bacterium]|nr:hypothetical protein [Streptosporangiaceae bacterium]
MNMIELRGRAEQVLARARDDDEFRDRLRNNTNEVLQEEGLLDAVTQVSGIPEAAEEAAWCFTSCQVTSCADYTCMLTVCPESCLPGVISTIYMQPPVAVA